MNSLRQKKAVFGFTLLEVLIALSILAIASIAVIRQTGQSLNQLQRLELKTTALHIAENQITNYRIAKSWPSLGRRSDTVTLGAIDWSIRSEITATPDPLLRKIVVEVGLEDQAPVVAMTAYRGQH